MPSLLGHAGEHGLSWKAYTGRSALLAARARGRTGGRKPTMTPSLPRAPRMARSSTTPNRLFTIQGVVGV